MRREMLIALVTLIPSLLIGCEHKYARTRPPEILVTPYQKVQMEPGCSDPVFIISADPEQIFIQTGRYTGYFLNIETGVKQPAPAGFDPYQTQFLARDMITVPMGGCQGPFRIDLHGKTIVREEAMGPGWGDKSPPISFIKRERFTGEMVLVVNGLSVLRQQVTDMYLRDLYIDYNLDFGLVIFNYRPNPDGDPSEDPMPEAYYLIRVPASHEVKSQPKPQRSGGVMGGRITPMPIPTKKKSQ